MSTFIQSRTYSFKFSISSVSRHSIYQLSSAHICGTRHLTGCCMCVCVYVCACIVIYHTWPSGNDGVIDKFLSLEPTVTFGWMYNLVVMWFSTTLAISHTFAMRRNITGNEQVNAHRYPHFHREDGRFTNPFDRGTWANILVFNSTTHLKCHARAYISFIHSLLLDFL
jgi:hypothetical protein